MAQLVLKHPLIIAQCADPIGNLRPIPAVAKLLCVLPDRRDRVEKAVAPVVADKPFDLRRADELRVREPQLGGERADDVRLQVVHGPLLHEYLEEVPEVPDLPDADGPARTALAGLRVGVLLREPRVELGEAPLQRGDTDVPVVEPRRHRGNDNCHAGDGSRDVSHALAAGGDLAGGPGAQRAAEDQGGHGVGEGHVAREPAGQRCVQQRAPRG
mmetsp:Transcript_51317/g.132397  ORF Transcript_51317/g.132397 Transcript_51317/m.132397 type:complete len:214 (+) Transcript_51317:252-893(+)